VAEVQEGELFRVECIDWTGGQIKDDDSAEDMKNVDLSVIHWLSGPIRVRNAYLGWGWGWGWVLQVCVGPFRGL